MHSEAANRRFRAEPLSLGMGGQIRSPGGSTLSSPSAERLVRSRRFRRRFSALGWSFNYGWKQRSPQRSGEHERNLPDACLMT